MTTKAQVLTLITLGATLVIASAQTTQTAAKAPAPPAPPPLSPTEQTIKDIKNPTSWLTWGADLRVRNEYFNNAQTLTSNPQVNGLAHLHSQDYFRFRGRVWATARPLDDLSLATRLTAEPREWMEPSSSANNRGASNQGLSGYEGRYGIVDNLYANWTNIAGLPARIKVGRQDLYFNADPNENLWGDGWLVADGTPLDGSWTFFMDAARATYDVQELHTTINAIGILQYAQPDQWLPTIGRSTDGGQPAGYRLTDQNEKGAILWIANKSLPAFNVDGYFIYKHDTRLNNISPPNAVGAGRFGDDADIYTLGGRVSGLVEEHWKYSFEGAYQCGRKHDPALTHSSGGALAARAFHDISAYGMNSRLSYLFNDRLKNQVYLAYEFLSGDDPGTGQDEMFDVLWGRWPRWSELYSPYSYIPETRTGQTANLYRFGPGWAISPTPKMDFNVNYNLMYSDHSLPTRANVPNAFSNHDNFRGHYLQTILKYKFSRHVAGHLWSEFVFPGHFYTSSGQAMTFLRAEMMFTF
jgi:hypothetical protein